MADDLRAQTLTDLLTQAAGRGPVLTAAGRELLDEGRAYAERLAKEGVEVAYQEYPDMVHGFILFGGVLDTSNAAVADCCAALRVRWNVEAACRLTST